MTEIYERNINVSVSKLGEREILTKASLLDLNHNIRVELTVDVPSKTIVSVQAQMVKSPFSIFLTPALPCGRAVLFPEAMIISKPRASAPFRFNFIRADTTRLGIRWPVYNDDLIKIIESETASRGWINPLQKFCRPST